jgi:hypothetical protein
MVRERYEFPASGDDDAFPQPVLTSAAGDGPSDSQTPLFLALLLTHLDLAAAAKRQTSALFSPVVQQLENVPLGSDL